MNISILVLDGGKKLKLEKLDINGIGGIKQLSLTFNPGLNVICGENGVGKTTVLNIIADAFSYTNRAIKRNVAVEKGTYTAKFDVKAVNEEVTDFDPEDHSGMRNNYRDAMYLMNLRVNRDIKYCKLNAVPSDTQRPDYQLGQQATAGLSSDEIKGWFVNRCLYSRQERGFTEVMRKNLEMAQKSFGMLDEKTLFDYIDPRSNDVILKTPKGEIYFEYLSSGYKTCIFIILGILKEIEFRFKDVLYDTYSGIILIDEVDIHLHPTWQTKLLNALKTIFRNSQIIVTTHSPSILQSIEKEEIIALTLNENGETIIEELNLGEYGLQGWTLEEILQDVMGMPGTTSELYEVTIKAFDKAMDDENIPEIKRNYEILDKMLHPDSTLRKLLQIQMAGMEE
ncbi:MAG: AAA family ATPase [Lachnospiraceae bacterium]|nr:AAA family ATPase [Lachnospiraceae bacterium]